MTASFLTKIWMIIKIDLTGHNCYRPSDFVARKTLQIITLPKDAPLKSREYLMFLNKSFPFLSHVQWF